MINKENILKKLSYNYDIINRDFLIGKALNASVLLIDGMANKDTVNWFVIEPLQSSTEKNITEYEIIKSQLRGCEISQLNTEDDCVTTILGGDAVLIIEKLNFAYKIGAKGYATRSISEPPTSVTIRGPREGFTEDMKTNSILIRRKLKTPDLIFDLMQIGRYSQTNVLICYIKSICNKRIVNKIKTHLKRIDIDAILDSSYVANFLDERKHSIFKQVGSTEKPDILASKLLEGRVGIIVDGSPMVLTLPFILLEDFQSPEDYYDKPQKATFSRLIRLAAVLLSILLPAIYVSAQVFHLQLMPLRFLTKIMSSVRQIPLTPAVEMFAVLLIFEILRESSIRMPKYVGNALAIVGGLVLGDTAVKAGIISTPSILIIAISSISLYTVPDQEGAISLLRIIFLLVGSTLGILGVMISTILLLVYLVSMQSYGSSYLMPFAPDINSDFKDAFIKKSIFAMQKRPFSIKNTNNTRQREVKYGKN